MKKVFIVGGNGFARECFLVLQQTGKLGKEIEFGGFLGHGGYGHTVDYKSVQHLYKGEMSEHNFTEDEYAIIGAGYPELRKKIYDDLKKAGANLYTLMGSGINVSESIKYGEGNIFISPFISSVDIQIGNGNLFNGGVIVGHDSQIGDFNFFGPRTQILGSAKIKDMNTIGANSILLPNSKIGSHNKIAPLSAIYKGCKDNCYMYGNPALKAGEVE